ncbi:MAG: OB-fold nucleic acid binding domain-containing protein [archaeon]|nr:OB-fold nucleic acid binding domain-containing protein [archaeon]
MHIGSEQAKIFAIFMALAGILGMVFIDPGPQKIGDAPITMDLLGQKIETFGTISSLRFSNNNAFFTLSNSSSTKSVYFSPKTSQMTLLREGEPIRLKGEVSAYEGELEIIVSEVERID